MAVASLSYIAYSICLCLAHNYLSELCKTENLVAPIVFQGGVARLKGMKRAFESILKQEIIVDEQCQLFGALGVAMLAQKRGDYNIENIGSLKRNKFVIEDYKTESFYCNDCNRNCNLVRYFSTNTEESFIIGGRCGKY